jgi:hypothetical protein
MVLRRIAIATLCISTGGLLCSTPQLIPFALGAAWIKMSASIYSAWGKRQIGANYLPYKASMVELLSDTFYLRSAVRARKAEAVFLDRMDQIVFKETYMVIATYAGRAFSTVLDVFTAEMILSALPVVAIMLQRESLDGSGAVVLYTLISKLGSK